MSTKSDKELDRWVAFATEMVTDPDLNEIAEELAEQFRSSLYENDGLEDRMTEIISDHLSDLGMPNPAVDDVPPEQMDRIMRVSMNLLNGILKRLIQKVFDEGDWQATQHTERQPTGPRGRLLGLGEEDE